MTGEGTPRIAFYAPLKSPRHPTPSGDRTIARLFLKAWQQLGYDVELASQLRARLATADIATQHSIAARGEAIAAKLIKRYRERSPAARPQAWFTYHCYYKAVDWIGPKVAAALDIPYLLAEASHAPKRASGDWAINHRGAEAAIKAAHRIFCLNPADKDCLAMITDPSRLIDLPPFLDLANFAPMLPDRDIERPTVAARHGLDPAAKWLLVVAMMRPGDKLASYLELATALGQLQRNDWQLLIIGDGAAEVQVRTAFDRLGDRIHFLGRQTPEDLPAYYAAADLFVWPAVNEAFGMALLEAQACGLPVLAGDVGGVSSILNVKEDDRTGWLVPAHDADVFAWLVDSALDRDRARIGTNARHSIEQHHDISSAARILQAHASISPATS